jgi:YggT family protein
MVDALTLIRYGVFALVVVAALVATASWLVRARKVSPFSPLGRGLRSISDPVITVVERRLQRSGGNPVHAGWWLVIAVAVIGIVGLSLLTWLVRVAARMVNIAARGPRDLAVSVVFLVHDIVFFALLARVILSWVGLGRYNRWLRPAYWLTDWLVEPIRRVLPPMGMFDLSPLVALLALWMLRAIVVAIIL